MGPVPPVRRPGIVRIFAVASRALRDAVRLPSAAVDPTTATLGLAAIGPAGKLGGQRPPGLFSVALVVAQAMIKLADEFVPDPAQRLLVAVTETASMLIQRPSDRGGVDRAERPVPAGVKQPRITGPSHQHRTAFAGGP